MISARLDLALERLTSSDWRRFEKFASEFLIGEFPNLRTTASPSGDGGRDAEIISFSEDPTHLLQYSVTQSWASKIRATAKIISKTHPAVQILTYTTNIQIGAQADEIKKELRTNYKIFLDVRDKSWFIERYASSTATQNAAESLAVDLVDPLLATSGLIKKTVSVLTDEETKAALVFLSLQLRDDVQEKGLTKLSFEALVRSVLIKTDSNNRLPRKEILERVRLLLPNDSAQHVDELTQGALSRLAKRVIRHYTKEDEYCLAYEESLRVKEYLASLLLEENKLQNEIEQIIIAVLPPAQIDAIKVDNFSARIRRILQHCLYARAESFAGSVISETMAGFAIDHLKDIVLHDLSQTHAIKGTCEADPDVIKAIIEEVFISQSDAIQQYLRDLSNAYTLMAFLKATPDVQNAMRKVFSHGEVWLDTSVILPLFAEELIPDNAGKLQRIIRVSSGAGIKFYVTSGVIEELESHLWRALVYARTSISAWEGNIPFIFEAYVQAGENPIEFQHWIDNFMGNVRSIDDLTIYLKERFDIEKLDLENDVNDAPADLRGAVNQIWFDIHEARRKRNEARSKNYSIDPHKIIRLAKHDTESYVGVVQRRQKEASSPLGYSVWWLTFDRLALGIGDALKNQHGMRAPSSPVLSIDFLSQCLSLSPLRGKVQKDAVQSLPISIEPKLATFLTKELLEEAGAIRADMKGLSERVISRKVRDHLDGARRRMGLLAHKGISTVFDEIGIADQAF